MRRAERLFLLVVTVLARGGVLAAEPGGQARGCEKDTDCKGERICEAGRCVNPPQGVAPWSPDAGAAILEPQPTPPPLAVEPWPPDAGEGASAPPTTAPPEAASYPRVVRKDGSVCVQTVGENGVVVEECRRGNSSYAGNRRPMKVLPSRPSRGSAPAGRALDEDSAPRSPAVPNADTRPSAGNSLLKFHPLAMIGTLLLGYSFGVTAFSFPLEVEHAVGPNASLFFFGSPLLLTDGRTTLSGIALYGGARLFFSGTAPKGGYLGFRAGLEVLAGGAAAGDLIAHGGYQWVLDSGFCIAVEGGVSMASLVGNRFPLHLAVPLGFAW